MTAGGDDTKEEDKKDDIGNADKGAETEKPWKIRELQRYKSQRRYFESKITFSYVTATEAPQDTQWKEDPITNEGDAPGYQPPQAPRYPPQQQAPRYVDHLSKMGAGLDDQANYFSYFVVLAILCIVCYLVFHNKQKVGAYLVVFIVKTQNS